VFRTRRAWRTVRLPVENSGGDLRIPGPPAVRRRPDRCVLEGATL